jgi:CheY-like chemotaxis protein
MHQSKEHGASQAKPSAKGEAGARLGGAAADFLGGLGRKAGELRPAIRALRDDPTRDRVRDDLRRKLHALGVGARLLHFEALAHAITVATERIDAAARVGKLPNDLLDDLEDLLGRLPELAWQTADETPKPPPAEAAPPKAPTAAFTGAAPWSVLVVGSEAIAQALEVDASTFPCEIERTLDVSIAPDLARAVAPDLVVIDVDLAGGVELAAALSDDPLTERAPIVAIGSGLRQEGKLSRLRRASVGKILEKPPAPALLREACADLVGERSRALPAVLHPEIGEVTVADLETRLVAELHRLLGDAVEPLARELPVDLGVGAEVLGPFWGALARIRDVVRDRSDGAITFRDDGLRRPIAVAPLGEAAVAEVERRTRRGGGPEIDLEGRVVIVADDDAAIAGFVGEALRAAGATVHETGDGASALSLARQHDASAIVADVLMPGLDGVSLARALRRDVVLRDRPLVLLSWKEDLLQRLRDLRVSSSATLRKDDDAATIVARVREVLARRVRIEARIAGGSEVRGRLDDLTPASLLRIVDRVRDAATIVVRDAAHLFEIELGEGGIRAITRTGADGRPGRGAAVLPGLLGVVGGRFLVRPRREGSPKDLLGDLDDQLDEPLARLRAACDAVSGVRMLELATISFDDEALASYLPSTPTPVRRAIEAIAGGRAPRAMILAGEIDPVLLEDVLVDAAGRGIVIGATSSDGRDLLALARARIDLVRVRGRASRDATPPPPPPPDAPRVPTTPPPAAPVASAPLASGAEPSALLASRPQASGPQASGPELGFDFLVSVPPPPTEAAGADPPISEIPSSLADAVLRVSSPGESTTKPPLLDARELRPRASARSDPPSAPSESSPERAVPAEAPPSVREQEPNATKLEGLSATPTPHVEPPRPRKDRIETLHGLAPTSDPPEIGPEKAPVDRLESAPEDRDDAGSLADDAGEVADPDAGDEPVERGLEHAIARSAPRSSAFGWILIVLVVLAAAAAWYALAR